MMKLISHTIFLKHKLEGHPEGPDRIRKALKLFDYEKAEDGENFLEKVHTERYISKVKEFSESGKVRYLDSGETYVMQDTYKAACHAVGAAVKAADYALKKQDAFALVRPPGHHAHPDWTNGFCIFNNLAIAAAYLAEKKEKVLIVDVDMHRGDGTSEVVQKLNKDLGNRLYYFSMNQLGVFPGMTIDEGQIKNIYLEPGVSEEEYIKMLKEKLPQAIRQFKPTVIAISAGFDTFSKDIETHAHNLGCGMSLSRKTILELKKLIKGTPYFAVLEGGYNPDSVVEGVSAFMGVAVKEEKKAAKKPKAKKEPAKKAPKSKNAAKKKKAKTKKAVKKKKKKTTKSSKGSIKKKASPKKKQKSVRKAKGAKKKTKAKKAKPKKKAAAKKKKAKAKKK